MTRFRSGISDQELSRRWSLVRQWMREADIDVLVMQGAQDWLGGMVRWFTDFPATAGYPRTVLFFAEGPMTLVEMGPFNGNRVPPIDEPTYRGVGRVLTMPSFSSAHFTHGYDRDRVLDELTQRGLKRVGVVNPGALPHVLMQSLLERFGSLVDTTDVIDTFKAVKSEEELGRLREVAHLQDDIFAQVLDFIRPGLKDIDVANFAQAEAHRRGSDQGILLGVSAQLGSSARFGGRAVQGRELHAGDHLTLLIEVNGACGMYTEIARTIVLGTASDKLLQAFDNVRRAQDHTLSLIRAGALPADIAQAHDAWMQAEGLPVETRLYAHGQGQDLVERPLIRHDETMPLAAGMCLAVHPSYDDGSVFAVICDNYIVEANGVSECLHRTEKKIFEKYV
ncbi:M24 family metallopeptidase [Rhizobium sp. FY34]|uniref:M24 family metallopeptidase n=1 Tax=Rhizobium sp. FY34 TaxID=2562309 RepID=UPI0010C15875|nr:M24 family metallopeptidase [Rhizobium sp. FY34]